MQAVCPLSARCVTSPAAEAAVAVVLALMLALPAFGLVRLAELPPAVVGLAAVAVALVAGRASLGRPVWRTGVLTAVGPELRFLDDADADADAEAPHGGPAPLHALRVTDLGPVVLLSWGTGRGVRRATLHARHHAPAGWAAWRVALGCRP